MTSAVCSAVPARPRYASGVPIGARGRHRIEPVHSQAAHPLLHTICERALLAGVVPDDPLLPECLGGIQIKPKRAMRAKFEGFGSGGVGSKVVQPVPGIHASTQVCASEARTSQSSVIGL